MTTRRRGAPFSAACEVLRSDGFFLTSWASRAASACASSDLPAPTSSVDAAPAATAPRSASSACRPSLRAARKPERRTSPPTGATDSTVAPGFQEPCRAIFAEQREAAGLVGDEHVSRAEVGDLLEREHEVLLLGQLGRSGPRPRAGSARRGTARRRFLARAALLGVEHGRHVQPVQLPDRLAVEARVDAARRPACEDDERRSAGQVAQLLERELRAPSGSTCGPHSLISLYEGAVGSTTAVDVRDSSAMRTKSLRISSFVNSSTMRLPGSPARVRRDHRHLEPFEAAGDVDALAARERERVAGPMAMTGTEARHRQRPVDGGVHGDGDDHEKKPTRFSTVSDTYQLTRPARLGSGDGAVGDKRLPGDESASLS